jgi:hypothetical protein
VTGLRPFWRYYGSKWRLAPRYPAPRHRTIIEPFAGAAGYSLRYPDHDVILVEKYHVIAEIWRYLIGVDPAEIRAIPCVDAVADLPAWVPQAARWLVGFTMGCARMRPALHTSAGLLKRRSSGTRWAEGWTDATRSRVADQVAAIRHWRVIDGDYTTAPDIVASWFVDAPYQGRPGKPYVHHSGRLDYPNLARWCRRRRGQVIACESTDAEWLPFAPLADVTGMSGQRSSEAIWTRDDSEPAQTTLSLEAG